MGEWQKKRGREEKEGREWEISERRGRCENGMVMVVVVTVVVEVRRGLRKREKEEDDDGGGGGRWRRRWSR